MAGSDDIELQAARWLLRRDGGAWNQAEQAQLDAWLAASTLHRVTYLRLEAGWEEASRLRVWRAGRGSNGELAPGLPEVVADEMPPPVPSDIEPEENESRSWWRAAKGARAAAALLLIGAAAVTGYQFVMQRGDAYSTQVGGSASIPLADGSQVTLNTASEIRVRLTEQERHIELTRGEAFFSVAKDANRPFVVQAGNRRVVAVGTQFSVQRDGDDIRVVVTEGVVRLESSAAPVFVKSTAGPAAGATRLAAGAVAVASDSNVVVQSQSVARAEEALSWRSGFVVFHETTLADAIAEFNRYNGREIVIADPQVATMRLTGKFRAANFDGFVRLLEDSLHLHVERVGDSTVISANTTRKQEHR